MATWADLRTPQSTQLLYVSCTSSTNYRIEHESSNNVNGSKSTGHLLRGYAPVVALLSTFSWDVNRVSSLRASKSIVHQIYSDNIYSVCLFLSSCRYVFSLVSHCRAYPSRGVSQYGAYSITCFSSGRGRVAMALVEGKCKLLKLWFN